LPSPSTSGPSDTAAAPVTVNLPAHELALHVAEEAHARHDVPSCPQAPGSVPALQVPDEMQPTQHALAVHRPLNHVPPT
jgi:hypothetical protein